MAWCSMWQNGYVGCSPGSSGGRRVGYGRRMGSIGVVKLIAHLGLKTVEYSGELEGSGLLECLPFRRRQVFSFLWIYQGSPRYWRDACGGSGNIRLKFITITDFFNIVRVYVSKHSPAEGLLVFDTIKGTIGKWNEVAVAEEGWTQFFAYLLNYFSVLQIVWSMVSFDAMLFDWNRSGSSQNLRIRLLSFQLAFWKAGRMTLSGSLMPWIIES